MSRAALALLCWLTLGTPAQADPVTRANEAAHTLNEAITAMQMATVRADRVRALSTTIQSFEDGLAALREGLRDAQAREDGLVRDLSARSDELTQMLALLLATDRIDPSVGLVHPQGALETARAGMLMEALAPAVAGQVVALRQDLDTLRGLRDARQYGLLTLEYGLEMVQEARIALALAIAERGPLPRRLIDSPGALETLRRSASTLDDFARQLAQTAGLGAPDSVLRLQDRKGTLEPPLRGVVLRSFNARDAAGVRRPGLVLSALPEALVTTPWSASVRYAGPLPGLDQVIILEPEDAILMVFAGLDTVFVDTGEILPQGSPIGTLPASDDPDAQGAGTRSQTLYFEMRRDGNPIDPEPWFAFSEASH